jgi:hypothetical protein
MPDVPDLLGELLDRIDDFATATTRRIRKEIPGYVRIPLDQHSRDVRSQLVLIITGLRDRRPTPPHAIDEVRSLGRRRAEQQLALPELVEAYHITYREIWNELLTNAARHDPDLTAALVSEVSLVWSWFHRLSSAAIDAHAAELRTLTTTRLALRRRLVEAIGTPGDLTEGAAVAKDLSFDTSGEFVVVCASPVGSGCADRIDASFYADGQRAIAIDHGGRTVLVGQGLPGQLLTALRRFAPDARAGIGLSRAGLRGAAAGLLDADQALNLATAENRDVRFADDWLQVVLHGSRARLAPLLASGEETAAAHPALADAVRAFAQAGYSVSACARSLHVHPNTAAYRLERWRFLTGWDVRILPHLVASLISINGTRAVD